MGQFAQFSDVTAEYEGVMPSSRQAWVEAKIDAVESRLIGLVPSLATLASSADPARFSRVKHLIVEKVLELYRNPSGVQQQTAGPYSTAYSANSPAGKITFTEEELSTIRQRNRRANLGTATVAPWRPQRTAGVFPCR